jgi:uncharacterized protein
VRPTAPLLLSRIDRPRLWLLLFALTALATGVLEWLDLPGAFLLGPMLAAIWIAINGAVIGVPATAFRAAQAVIGAMIASTFTRGILASFLDDWALFLGVTLACVALSSLIGWLFCRWRVLPGTAGIWGSTPGAASAMVLMAEEFGADVRLVAFMQYLRVACVVVAASLVTHVFVGRAASTAPVHAWLAVPHWGALAQTLAVVAAGATLGVLLRLPSGVLIGPMLAGAVAQLSGWLTLELPAWLLAPAFVTVGWVVGLRFTRGVLQHALRSLPYILASIVLLMAFCAVLAWLLARLRGIDMLTAFLATSPGGADSIAIIAASANVDQPFVMAFQTVRLFVVFLAGPLLARLVAKRFAPDA